MWTSDPDWKFGSRLRLIEKPNLVEATVWRDDAEGKVWSWSILLWGVPEYSAPHSTQREKLLLNGGATSASEAHARELAEAAWVAWVQSVQLAEMGRRILTPDTTPCQVCRVPRSMHGWQCKSGATPDFGEVAPASTPDPPASRKLLRARSRDRGALCADPYVHLVLPGETKALCDAYLGDVPVAAEDSKADSGKACLSCALMAR